MSGQNLDLVIVGGGLAGGLIAMALHRQNPDLSLTLIESGAALGGNHRWSWFDSDLTPDGRALMDVFPTQRWEDGYDVKFPAHSRRLHSSYNSLVSNDFDAALRGELPADRIQRSTRVTSIHPDGVTLSDGEHIAAKAVIDCRTFEPSPHLSGGWQVFLGQTWRMDAPHGVERPVIMDATVDQHGAYRFVYLLPLSATELFIEDTYYADSPKLDRGTLSERVAQYCSVHGWSGNVFEEETGVLPVITHGDFAKIRAETMQPSVAAAGARALFTHPLTSYTLPTAVSNALVLAGALAEAQAEAIPMSGAKLSEMFANRSRQHWRSTRFYRSLGRMLFDAAEPDLRYRIFERFYRLPEPLIERFYAAQSTPFDRARIICGKPPVPITAAIRALAGSGSPLVKGEAV